MFLDSASKSLEIILGTTQTTNPMPVVVDYTDKAGEHETAGALTHGKVKDHTHNYPYQPYTFASGPGSGGAGSVGNTATLNPNAPEGGADNLAAALGINYILKL